MNNAALEIDATRRLVDALLRAEGTLLGLLNSVSDDRVVLDLASVLRDLSTARRQLEEPGPQDKRTSARIHERAVIRVFMKNAQSIEAALYDISAGGALIECDQPPTDGSHCDLELPGIQEKVTARVCGTRNGLTHLAFDHIDTAPMLALLKYLGRHFERY